MRREFRTFIGIDLGGARGKTTAVCRLVPDPDHAGAAVVESVGTRHASGEPWHDDRLVDYLRELAGDAVVAIDAPLTAPACLRCAEPVCPGAHACEVPAVVWLRTRGAELQAQRLSDRDRDRIAAIPSATGFASRSFADCQPSRQRLAPYTHRCTEVILHYTRDLIRRETLSQGSGPVSARAVHLHRVLAGHGFRINHTLLEVSPRSTIRALFGARVARGYKRDADPWKTRAAVLEALKDRLTFAPQSRLAREEVLRNDHCFEALVSGYTAFLWAREGWELPAEQSAVPAADLFDADGWIWVPPERQPG